MIKIKLSNKVLSELHASTYEDIVDDLAHKLALHPSEYYLEHNGRRFTAGSTLSACNNEDVKCILRLPGGKGGFGSMLRAIGAQIEKTTNREACRDLSGRRLRDINEEKRLKAWLEKQSDREREADERKKRKIEKLLAVPKHDFQDGEYEESRSKLTEKVNDAVEEGFKKMLENKQSKTGTADESQAGPSSSMKRKGSEAKGASNAKKKRTLWIGDISDDSDDTSSSDSDNDSKTAKSANKESSEDKSKKDDVVLG